MQENLVIIESPVKAKTIEKFLGKDYKAASFYGHIRDLEKKELSINLDTLNSDYEAPDERKKVASELKKSAKAADKVWLTSDEDREGEAISWHLCEVLRLDEDKTNRVVFHEVTKPAILKAIESPCRLDTNLVDAQQTRRVLDRLVSFRLSPVLWCKVEPALSTGRVQSAAVGLIVERECEIQNFDSESYYRLNAVFTVTSEDGSKNKAKAKLNKRFRTHEEALAFLELCKTSKFKVSSIAKKPSKHTLALPFTISTLQQETAKRLGFTVSRTMMVAQRLYEIGRITYIRTDSVSLSAFAIEDCRTEIERLYGGDYDRARKYQTYSKGAQKAHETIHSTCVDNIPTEGASQEKCLHGLIWKHTTALQMADIKIEKAIVNISFKSEEAKNTTDSQFIANGEVVAFEGSLKVCHESADDDENSKEPSYVLPVMHEGEELERHEIVSTERYSQGPNRYTEADLVRKLEEFGIGHLSTYAPTISTIQQHEYVQKGDRKGGKCKCAVDSLLGLRIASEIEKKTTGADKGRLIPAGIDIVVDDFLMGNFPNIMDYNFMARIEQEFDKIAEGKAGWNKEMRTFHQSFESEVEKVMDTRSEHKTDERELSVDPTTGKPVFVKIGRFGPVVQIGSTNGEGKPRFSQLPSDKSMETITLDEALELFKLPRNLGQFEGTDVAIDASRFGPYVLHDKRYTSLPKEGDPLTISLGAAISLIQKKRLQDAQCHLKTFEEDAKMEVMNGCYGSYVAYDGKNYRTPKTLHDEAAELTYEQCMDIVKNASEPKRKK